MKQWLFYRSIYEHVIRDKEGFVRHVDYVHWNPVKHGWADQVNVWPYFSFHPGLEHQMIGSMLENVIDAVRSSPHPRADEFDR